ncbi:MAG: hypothetical protein QXO15_01025 [Nitrososphaerota archaeon]
MREAIKRILTVRRGRSEGKPSQTLLAIVYFSILSIAALTTLEVTYMLVFRSWSSEIFAAISALIGQIIGILVSRKT